MTASEIEEELEWKEELYEINEEKLEENLNPESLASALRMLSKSAIGKGICLYLLEDLHGGRKWMKKGVEDYLAFDDAVTEYGDEVPGSRHAHRPTHYKEAMSAVLLSAQEDLIHQVSKRIREVDEATYLDEWGDWGFQHVLYYTEALACVTIEAAEDPRSYLQQLDELGHGYENYEALHDCLLAIVNEDRTGTVEGVARLLEWHQNEYGQNPSTATDFISVDATALLVLARRSGLDISPEDFDESLREFLPLALFDS